MDLEIGRRCASTAYYFCDCERAGTATSAPSAGIGLVIVSWVIRSCITRIAVRVTTRVSAVDQTVTVVINSVGACECTGCHVIVRNAACLRLAYRERYLSVPIALAAECCCVAGFLDFPYSP